MLADDGNGPGEEAVETSDQLADPLGPGVRVIEQATHEALRDAALRLALEHGPDNVRVEDIAEAIVAHYADPGEHRRNALLLVTTHPALRAAFLGTTGTISKPLAAVIAERCGAADEFTAPVLAAGVAAAIRVALEHWLQPPTGTAGFVVVSGSLPELLRAALAPLAPALDAATGHRTDPPDSEPGTTRAGR